MRSKSKPPRSQHHQKSDDTRTALLIRCTRADAEVIRNVAKREHRTISGFIMHVVMNYIGNREAVLKKVQEKLHAATQDRNAKAQAA